MEVIQAPHDAPARHAITLFLAGTATIPDPAADWRQLVTAALGQAGLAVTVLNPYRRDWGWPNDLADAAFAAQTRWEFERIMAARLVLFWFDCATDAPGALLELGLCAGANEAVVGVHPRYSKRGNVEFVSQRYGWTVVHSLEELVEATRVKVAALAAADGSGA